jgi:hypothetical protein
MTIQYKGEFKELVKNNKLHRFTTQLQYCNDIIETKKIKSIIDELQIEHKDNSNKAIMKEYLEKIDSCQYRKKWCRLKPFQKEDRLINFIETEKISKDIADQLFEMHKDKKFNSKTITYDPTTSKITSINKLIKNDDGEYELKD